MGRAAGLWQDWEEEAIYRMRRTGQSWEDINTAVPERTLPAIVSGIDGEYEEGGYKGAFFSTPS